MVHGLTLLGWQDSVHPLLNPDSAGARAQAGRAVPCPPSVDWQWWPSVKTSARPARIPKEFNHSAQRCRSEPDRLGTPTLGQCSAYFPTRNEISAIAGGHTVAAVCDRRITALLRLFGAHRAPLQGFCRDFFPGCFPLVRLPGVVRCDQPMPGGMMKSRWDF